MFRRTFHIICLVLLCTLPAKAQEGKVILGLRAGHNAVAGGFAAASLEADYYLKKHFSVTGGLQYNSIGKCAAEIRPAYFHDMAWGRISAELLMHYTHSSGLDNMSAGAGLGVSTRWISAKAGYYYRTYEGICEPFNLYYALTVNCLPMIEKWDLLLMITNSEIFELERHYQPSFIMHGWYYPTDNIGITVGAGLKLAGMFNLAAGYHQFHTKAGICYRW